MQDEAYDGEDSTEEEEYESSEEKSDDNEDDNREVTDQDNSEDESDENKLMEKCKKIIKDFFSNAQASLPPKKKEVEELHILLPGHSAEKQKVVVRLSKPHEYGFESFEKRYKEQMRRTIRNLWLQKLKANGDEDAVMEFLKAEMIVQGEGRTSLEEDDEGMAITGGSRSTTFYYQTKPNDEENEGYGEGPEEPSRGIPAPSNGIPGTSGFSFPYWLSPLLSNDLFYLVLVCETMFGWTVPPLTPNAANHEMGQLGEAKHNLSSIPILMRGNKPYPESDALSYKKVSFVHTSNDNDRMQSEDEEQAPKGVDDLNPFMEEEIEEVEEEIEGMKSKGDNENLENESNEKLNSPSSWQRVQNKILKGKDQMLDEYAPPNALKVEHSDEKLTSVVTLLTNQRQDFIASNRRSIIQSLTKTTTQTSASATPKPEIVAFPDLNYKLYVVWEKNEEEWQLLDVNPMIVEHHAKAKLLRKSQKQEKEKNSDEDQSEEDDEKESEDNEQEEEEDHMDEDQSNEESEEYDDDDDSVPSFNYDSVIVLDALMLAALQAPSFLKTCFLQNLKSNGRTCALSLGCLEHWLVMDEDAGFPMLNAVYTGLMSARLQYSVTPLPYQLPALKFDFNYFFQEGVLFRGEKPNPKGNAVPCYHLLPGSSRLMLKQLDSLTNSRSKQTMDSMGALLSANILPSRPISLNRLTSPESLGLALWLLASIPEWLLYVWEALAKTQNNGLAKRQDDSIWTKRGSQAASDFGEFDDDDDDDEDDGMEEEEEGIEDAEYYRPRLRELQRAEAVWRRRLEHKICQLWHGADAGGGLTRTTPKALRNDPVFPPALLTGALLFSTLVEIRSRLAREQLGRKPLTYPLTTDLEKFMESKRLEDGVVDPLITSSFRPQITPDLMRIEGHHEDNTPREGTNVFAEFKNVFSPPKHKLLEGMATPTKEGNADPPQSFFTQRHQKIYQSDLVLLLLACTNTPMPRPINALCTQEADFPQTPMTELANLKDQPIPTAQPISGKKRATVVNRVPQTTPSHPVHQPSSLLGKPMFAPISGAIIPNVNSTPSGVLNYHLSYFNALLQAKIQKQQSGLGSSLPLTKARSGMWRFLFLLLPLFLNQRMIQEFCDAAPLYELFGVNERCPLHELIYYWMLEVCNPKEFQSISRGHSTGEKSLALNHMVNIFVNTFCHELYHRLKAELYPKNILSFIRACSNSSGTMMLSKVQDQMDRLEHVLANLPGIRYRGTKGVDARYVDFSLLMNQLNLQYRMESSMPDSANNTRRTVKLELPVPINAEPAIRCALPRLEMLAENVNEELLMKIETTSVVESIYNEPFRSATQRLVASFATLPMTAPNIFTPELLFELLFADPKLNTPSKKRLELGKKSICEVAKGKKKELNFVAVRYVVVEKHVTTVRERGPFSSPAIPALEYAILHGYIDAAVLLVSLGASLGDLILNGSMTLETFLERCWPVEKATQLRQLWRLQTCLTRLDPDYRYSVLRPVV
ncbi:unnamed protein product [Phytomonas sp. Hart1]|nr:unnamed protein product [Phytomonas sp. Hart1]|eukprot:CCW66212.1 unnamed protein product [Phytomonas sp. isolate Hart1]